MRIRKSKYRTPAARMRYVLKKFYGGNPITLARALGVSVYTVGRWLRTGANPPGKRARATLYNLHGITPDWIVTGLGQDPINGAKQPGVMAVHDFRNKLGPYGDKP